MYHAMMIHLFLCVCAIRQTLNKTMNQKSNRIEKKSIESEPQTKENKIRKTCQGSIWNNNNNNNNENNNDDDSIKKHNNMKKIC